MNNTNQEKLLENTKSALFLILLSFIVNAWFAGSWSFYADDWVQMKAVTDLTWLEFKSFFIREFLFNGELRPFRAIEWLIKKVLYDFGGLSSVYIFQSLLVGISGYLLFLILRKRAEFTVALLVASLFLLSPIDSTSIWLPTFHWKFSLLLSLLSAYLILQNKIVWASVACIFSLLFHETPISMLCLAPLIAYNPEKHWKDNKEFSAVLIKSICIFCLCFGTYIIWRKFITPLYMSDFRMNFFLKEHDFKLGSLIIEQFKRTLYGYMAVLLLPFGVLTWKLSIWHLLLCIFAGSYFAFILQDKTTIFPSKKISLYLIALGLITIPFAYWLALYQAPARHLGMDSKLNLPASISFALFYFGVFSLIYTICLSTLASWHTCFSYFKNKNLVSRSFNIIGLSFLFMLVSVKFTFQQDYTEAKNIQNQLFSKIQVLQISADKTILYKKTYPNNMAIEAVAPYGGPWSPQYTVYPKHLIKIKPTSNNNEVGLWVDGVLSKVVRKENIIELD
jgi:hypothetical protein